MAIIYTVDIKFPAASIGSLRGRLPGDFDRGEHATVRLHIDEGFWVVRQNDATSDRLLNQYFGATQGTISGGAGNYDMATVRGKIGTFALSMSTETQIEGAIGTEFKTGPAPIPGTGVPVFTKGYYYRRRVVWSDRSANERFSILLDAASRHASGQTSELISGLLVSIPMVAAVTAALIYLGGGTPVGQGVGLILALVLGGLSVTTRGQEYWNELSVVEGYWHSANEPNQAEIDRAGKSLATFFRMVLEDCAFAIAAEAASGAVHKWKSGQVTSEPQAREAIDDAWKRGSSEEALRAQKRSEVKKAEFKAKQGKPGFFAEYTAEQLKIAQDNAFPGMPKFRKGKSSALKRWLIDNGFVFQKKAILEKGKTSNAGGSEIWVRQSGTLAKNGLAEVVRIDVAGHDAKVFPGEEVFRWGKDGKPKVTAWGGLKHFHKDIVPLKNLFLYCKEFVPEVVNISDHGNLIDPRGNYGTKNKWRWADIHIELSE